MEVKKPFGFTKALFVIHFLGMNSFNSDVDNYYPIVPDEEMEETWNALKEKTEQRFPDKYSTFKKIIIDEHFEVRIVPWTNI